ncbi:MAG: hypothetical protein JXA54_12855 [Candidatus Heimdallarchaeota archaeon]|nr:hypothetical protein [Candidatus Heimdallarchaeota archaeon]
MKKGRKITLIIFCSLVIFSGILIPILPFMMGWNPAYGTPILEFPFETSTDIVRLRAYNLIESGGSYEGHHTGIDLEISINGTKVISPCSGTVGFITSTVNKNKGHIMISINIRINLVWSIMLVFEPYSNSTEFHEYQMSLIKVKFGQKIEVGEEVGFLLIGGEFPHIHYTVNRYFGDVCPYEYSSNNAKAFFEEIAIRTNSTICYP